MISVTEIESDMFLEKVNVSGHMSHAECDVCQSVWRVSEEHRKIVTILKNAPILDFHCIVSVCDIK
jgi:hypothetical protein